MRVRTVRPFDGSIRAPARVPSPEFRAPELECGAAQPGRTARLHRTHSMHNTVTTSIVDDVAVVQIDNPPVNALSHGVPEGLMAAIDEAEANPSVRAIVILGAGRTFVAGADIKDLEAAAWNTSVEPPDIHNLLTRVEDA